MPKFVRKPIVVEAYQWPGDLQPGAPDWLIEVLSDPKAASITPRGLMLSRLHDGSPGMAKRDDWIVNGSEGLRVYTDHKFQYIYAPVAS